jgi:hypothetical protein
VGSLATPRRDERRHTAPPHRLAVELSGQRKLRLSPTNQVKSETVVQVARLPRSGLYQAPKSLTLRLVVIVMAGGGPPSTSLLITAGKDVDADLRRHDDSAATRGSS